MVGLKDITGPRPVSSGEEARTFRSRWLGPALVLAGYTVLALIYGAQLSVYKASIGAPPVFGETLLTGAIVWGGWAALTPFILAVARRVRGTGRPWPVQLALHLPPAVFFATAHLALLAGLRQLLLQPAGGGGAAAWTYFTWLLSKTTDFDLLIYLSVVGLDATLRYARQVREEAVRASGLQAQLAQAQLHLLRSQLRPHFLFNTLHAISTLMHRDVDAADRMVGQLSELLRASLERDGRHEVPLSEELDLLAPYLDIERTRFSDRLQVDVEVAPDVHDALVPPLVLQPLVENAIRHGIAPRRGPGRVWVRVQRAGDRLSLEVRDDGVGPPAEGLSGLSEGIGLGSTRARLERLYGVSQSLTCEANAPRGFVVSLSLPFRSARA
ncbi:sensor histidine kinase [Myxococcus llanfairpwllgwyngyllgogerychwyrndrobwllllantysiliogogogochensis]|uniref:sensor histidine kinase n=1 Tax=Myxococcus llanfairpwllgwyngyllgogerychwyrndrobwllllantysiliogogogochensis TaxID=2590453 RepID=UPI001FED25A6|nr:histidine kinase [Myxococcus llanfairpwllgwyngyllgogerychwyrndrobwllllantysiliogogogochensis]